MKISNYEILANVLKVSRISLNDFFGKTKTQRIVFARALFSNAANDNGSSFGEIAKFTKQHRSTSHYHVQNYAVFFRFYPNFKVKAMQLNKQLLTTKQIFEMSEKIEKDGKVYYEESAVANAIGAAVKTALEAVSIGLEKKEEKDKEEFEDTDPSAAVKEYLKEVSGESLGGRGLDFDRAKQNLMAKGSLGGKTI